MKKKTVELYSQDDIAAIEKKRRIWIAAAAAAALITLAVCVYFCIRANTLNAERMLLYCIISSVIGGWIVISILRFPVYDLKYAKRHTMAILTGEREEVRGDFTVTDERVRIINGVSMYKVAVDGAERVRSLQLFADKKELFDGSAHSVISVHGFIAAYEAGYEND
ncbi:MAG: hypothetical protein J5586_02350 [Clostridia bacterium]|nr:hypothetical protein [Clostridia bacterium]